MDKFKRLVLIGLAALVVLVPVTWAMVVKYNNYLANEAGLTYNKNFGFPLNSYGADNLSAVTVVSSDTFANATFTDGQQSTGTITVATVSGLSASSATNNITIETTTIPSASILTVNGTSLYLTNYADITTTATAINIKNAINALVPGVLATVGGANSVVYATATTAGLGGNNMTLTLNVSTNTLLFATYTSSTSTSGISNFTGGRDPAVVTVNGQAFMAGRDFTVTSLTSSTASNLATAINASSNTTFVIAATSATSSSVVKTTSTFVGAITNYVLTSSTDAALTIGGSTKTVTGLNGASIGQMWGGSDAGYTLLRGSATVVTVANTGTAYTLGLPVLYTGTPAITGLTTATTYFVIPVSSNSISLSATSTGAVAGLALVLTSSSTKTTADVYTLAPLAISGNTALGWQVSNDGLTWIPYTVNDQGVAISSYTISTYISTGSINSWDFGNCGYAFIRLAVIAPTQGAVRIQAALNAKGAKE